MHSQIWLQTKIKIYLVHSGIIIFFNYLFRQKMSFATQKNLFLSPPPPFSFSPLPPFLVSSAPFSFGRT